MQRHKTGCPGPCSRDRHCNCSRCAPKKNVTGPTGPCCTGPTGPGTSVTGPTGPCCTGPTGPGPDADDFGSIEKWATLLALPVVLTPTGDTSEVCTYMADAIIGGLSVQVTVPPAPPLPVSVPLLTSAPNYPSTRRGITFDELAVNAHTFIGADVDIPAGAALVVELVENAGQVNESVCLTATLSTGAGIVTIPAFGDPPLLARAPVGTCFIEPGNTYDVRVCIRNVTEPGVDVPFLLAAGVSIELSVTARVVSA